MKLKCNKCKTLLTEDLRPVKVKFNKDGYIFNKWQVWTRIPDPYHNPEIDGEIVSMEYGNMKSGVFYQTKKAYYNHTPERSGIDGYYRVIKEYPQIVVSGNSIVDGVIPPFESGWGCCNWGGAELKCPSCGTELGEMHLDCYQDYSVRFDVKKVERCYK